MDILCSLLDETLSLTALSAGLGKPAAVVAYHLKVLGDCNVVERIEWGKGCGPSYAVCLDEQPPWVAEALAGHQELDSNRPAFLTTVRLMVGMRCDECERLLQFQEPVVAVYETDGKRQAKTISKDSPGIGEALHRRAIEKYHWACYALACERDPFLPPI